MNDKSLPQARVLMLTGVILSAIGILVLISPVAVGGAVVKLVALVLMVTGVVQLIQAVRSGATPSSIVGGILGLIVVGLGVMIWRSPEGTSNFLTAMLMLFFLVNGLWKVSTALRYRRVRGGFWLLGSGVLALLFVYLIWRQWPLAGLWAIGVYVGVDLLLTGLSLITLARARKRVVSSSYVDTIHF